MGTAVSSPNQRLISHVLCVEHGCECSVPLGFGSVHCHSAVFACVLGVGAGDADVQREQAVATRSCEDIRRSELRTGDEARSLDLRRGVAVPGDLENFSRNSVASPRLQQWA